MIDFHTHVFSREAQSDRERLLALEPWFGELYLNPRRALSAPEDLLRAMDEGGVERSVALSFPFRDAGRLRAANDELAEAASLSGGRVIGFGLVDPVAADAPAEVERLAGLGLRGIGEINSDAQGFTLDDPRLDGFLEAVRANGLILLLHASEPVGRQYPGKGTATPDRVISLLRRAAGIPIVLAHLGGGLPFYAGTPGVADLLDHVYFDTAALPYLYSPAALRAAGDVVGWHRLLFGSDYPLLQVSRYTALLAEGVPEQHREAVWRGNAATLLSAVPRNRP